MHPQVITQASFDFLKREATKTRKMNPELTQKEALNEVAVKWQFKDWFHLKNYAKKLESEIVFVIERGTFFHDENERLQLDEQWREVNDSGGLKLGDYATASLAEARSIFIKLKSSNPRTLTFGLGDNQKDHFSYNYRVFRKSFPRKPSIQDLENVIANGDDTVMNTLVLNCKGKFELREWKGSGALDNDATVVCRHETNVQNGGYVGLEASQDKKFIMREYLSSLEYWLKHLESGQVGFFADLPSNKTLNALNSELDIKEKNWTAEYQWLSSET